MKNILFIMGDQHRWDCIGAYGNKVLQTPNIDGLAKDGVLHTQHYTTYPVCTPSRYSILSGLYTHQHLGWSNTCTLAKGFSTFPKVLRKEGYRTVAIGKMHATPTYLDMGFDKMLLCEQDGNGRYDDDYHKYLKENNLIDENDLIDQRHEFRLKADETYWNTCGAIKSNLDEKHHSTTWITDRALEELEGWGKEGHMMLVSYVKPHHPFDPPAPYDTMYNPDEIELLPGYTDEVPEVDYAHNTGYFDHKTLTKEKLKKITAYYYGSISHMDHHIGRLVQALKDKGIYEDTLIVYTSDHGEYLGFHHMLLKANYMYDPLAKVPLIIKYPKNQYHGQVNEQISCNIDLAPTFLSQADCAIPGTMKGLDLSDQKVGRQMTICEGFRADICDGVLEKYYEYMVRSKNYKLIISKNFEHYMFFDLINDPYELKDVSNEDKYKEEIEKHKAFLAQTMTFDALSPIYLNEDEQPFNEAKRMNEQERREMEVYCMERVPYAIDSNK
nr:sulfatase-like hydrolase/transferase [uncultured Niameybacter sp.]